MKIPTIFILFCLSLSVGSCSSEPKLSNRYFRSLSDIELEQALIEKDAELIFREQRDQQTFVVLDVGDEILQGTYQFMVNEYENKEPSEHLNYSLYGTPQNPDTKIVIQQGLWAREYKDISKKQVLYSQDYVVIAVRDPRIREELKSFRFTFMDRSQETVSATYQSGILFQHDLQKDCCARIDLISKSDQTLFSKDFL